MSEENIQAQDTGQPESQQPQTSSPDQEPVLTAADTSPSPVESEKLYAGKFKTPEEMERAYFEAESRMHQSTTTTAEMRRQLDAMQQAANTQQQQQLMEQYRQQFDADPVGFMMMMNQQAVQNANQSTAQMMSIERTISDWRNKNSDLADPVTEEMVGYVIQNRTDPNLPHAIRLQQAGEIVRKEIERITDSRIKTRKKKEEALREAITEKGSQSTPQGVADQPESASDYIKSRQKMHEDTMRTR
jgi:PAS domain-containing protein